MDSILSVLTPIHREGHKYIVLFAVVTLLLFLLWEPLGWIGVVLTAWCAYFFRDPDRVTPVRDGLIVAPADGVIQSVADAVPPGELELGDEPRPRISIFMNVFDVHVNRVPASGEVIRVCYTPGKFLNAELEKASEDNERNGVVMTTEGDKTIAFVQIAGLVARRIVCHLEPGQKVLAGERFGIIRFGSRVDVYLDSGMKPLVCVGQRTIAGETVLADVKSRERQRVGEVR
ncbi:MAG: phosphatidylserine decarboxylase [Alphaproteobacteria bacterium]|nr:MAG: phosphatidylserine decarboxylase [Alphaproteobacteria bacterium]